MTKNMKKINRMKALADAHARENNKPPGLLSILTMLVFTIFFLVLGHWKQQLKIATIKEENATFITLSEINCFYSRSYGALLFTQNGRNYHINIHRSLCDRFKVGEQIKVYYNSADDMYLLKIDGREDEDDMVMAAGIMFFIGLVIYLLWFVYFRQYVRNIKIFWQMRQQ